MITSFSRPRQWKAIIQSTKKHFTWKKIPVACVWLVMPLLWLLPVLAGCGTNAQAQPKIFNVRESGATGDGKTLDTKAVQKALDACGQAGGGTVLFPAGTYLSQPLTLRTKTTVLLEAGATLLATTNQRDFMKTPGNWLEAGSSSDFIPFIGGKRLTDITFTGQGTIDGNGAAWWGEAEKARQVKPGYTLPRPNLIVLDRCQNVRLENITLENSPKFHFVPSDCEDVVVSNVTILAPAHAANTDAIDPSGRRMLITKCRIDVGDDDVAIKAGRRIAGHEFESEDITVTDCTILHGHGISIGSETLGGVRNVTVRNCTFENTENGLRIKSQRGKGGLVENIRYSDITMKNVVPAITLTCYYMNNSAGDTAQPSAAKADTAQLASTMTPVFRDIYISNLTATCQKSAGVITGLPESEISNVVLANVRISSSTGMTIKNASGVQFKNVQITTEQGPPVIIENAHVEGAENVKATSVQ
ncbi:MAG TPA: glycoside hydrolase family 28 protein [Candidatus Limnocylindrales bacterium]|nr:glycoside hydrolase family 28 protein [Candidatus Limnocylindrales bacterium]